MTYRRAADLLTALRAICGIVLVARPSLAVLCAGVITDWIDGPLARRSGASGYGARFDLEADSFLTLGASMAAVRRGAPAVVLLAPIARYRVRPARTADERRWDRLTGVAQMLALGAALGRLPATPLSILTSAARCAALLARARPTR